MLDYADPRGTALEASHFSSHQDESEQTLRFFPALGAFDTDALKQFLGANIDNPTLFDPPTVFASRAPRK